MGAWGHGSFQNDDALGFLEEFEDGGLETVEAAFDTVNSLSKGDYLEAPDAGMALAAAEMVAAVRDGDTSGVPDDAAPALARHQEALSDPALLDTARRAVTRVFQASELKELWQDTPDWPAWQEVVRNLASRLR